MIPEPIHRGGGWKIFPFLWRGSDVGGSVSATWMDPDHILSLPLQFHLLLLSLLAVFYFYIYFFIKFSRSQESLRVPLRIRISRLRVTCYKYIIKMWQLQSTRRHTLSFSFFNIVWIQLCLNTEFFLTTQS